MKNKNFRPNSMISPLQAGEIIRVKMTIEQERAYIEKIEETIRQGNYKDDWNSLFQMEVPAWFADAKFGIFIHWGLYSVAAHANEWYPRNMYIQEKEEWEYHRKTFGEHTRFGYKDFIPMFQAEKFNPEEWAELFAAAGAKYVFPVAEHHDGFMMYKSRISKYNAYEMGPKRDILGELKLAFAENGLHFCTSSHRAEHWFFLGHGKEFDSDLKDPLERGDMYWPSMSEPDPEDLTSQPYPSKEYLEDWMLRTCEIIDRYQPEILYFDWWIQHAAFKPYLKKVAAYYYNQGVKLGRKHVICYKHDAMAFGSGIVEVERGGLKEVKPYHWQTDTAIAKNSWCYTDTLEYKTSHQIISTFIDVISKNGNMLLNVGPKGDGSIPQKDRNILLEIGAWMKQNEEAIYGSRPWRKSKEGPTKEREGQFTDNEEMEYTSEDIRFTCKGSSIYAFVLKYPKDGKVCIRSLAESKDQNIPQFHGLISKIRALGFAEDLSYTVNTEGLHIISTEIASEMPVVFQIETE